MGILRLTQDDDFTLTELAQTLSADPALSGRILKLANSALSAGVEPVTDVLSASMRLGVRSVRSVALGFSLISENRSGVCAEFDYERYWSLSLAAAVMGQCLASTTHEHSPAEVFTCALLSKVGMLALASVHPVRYAKALRTTRGGALSTLLEAEAGAFDITHAQVTAALLRDWELPETFAEVALRLGESGRPKESLPPDALRLLRIVNVAWVLAPRLVAGSVQHTLTEERRFLRNLAKAQQVPLESLGLALAMGADAWMEWRTLLELADRPRRARSARSEPHRDAKPDVSELLEADEPEDGVAIDPLVMVVDDDERIIRLLKHVLEKDGFRLLVARNGKEALELAAAHQPQIIITDWRMPEVSGVELCRRLKSCESLRRSYVIMLSAQEAIEDIEEGFTAGADDYVCKPFSTAILLARVRGGRRVLELQAQLDRDREVRSKQMAELGSLTRKLRAVTMTDMLTELPNRRYARRRLYEEWQASQVRDEPLSLIMIDIDHFKRINDQYGHDTGDHVLRETARVLKDNTRLGDVVCRFGGEEFLVINIDCDKETALQCCERLRAAVEANHIRYGEFDGNVTISLGVAERLPGTHDVDALLKAADLSVYRAKNSGRNRIDGGSDADGGALRSA